ncbi:Uma2 family endonuclease [Streptomyces sp. IB2014 016-6]|uniref:Uma2 family endonuclease n=1 Tax=Streptomyces sp. IB2014 016-6 TaxID=2517818 RepID=UPI0011CB046F|nr:Uma2 family endonuclease [Streptomyces sp. IB2014 016-6]TXL87388.1 Uma2 family endonuclease [Streptomyces sp. IB2014 016-6]
MSAAAAEHPYDGAPESLLEAADSLMERQPGFRVEIIGGVITVAPPPDGAHARALRKLARPFEDAGLDEGETEVLQAIGLWLPAGPEDFAIPDLSLVDADFEEHLMQYNCYDPAVFRLVLEVTSSNYQQDLRNKVTAYAEAEIPVYVIVDRKHSRLHVLTDPVAGDYASHRIHAPGEQIVLPESIGAEVKLDVSAVLKTGEPRNAT